MSSKKTTKRSELLALESSPGFKSATKSRKTLPAEDDYDDEAEGSHARRRKRIKISNGDMDVDVRDDDDGDEAHEDEGSVQGSRSGSRQRLPSRKVPQSTTPSKRAAKAAAPTPSKSTLISPTKSKPPPIQDIIFVTVGDPRLSQKKKPAGKSTPTKTGAGTPSRRGRGSAKKRGASVDYEDEEGVEGSPTKARSARMSGGRSLSVRSGRDESDDGVPGTPSKTGRSRSVRGRVDDMVLGSGQRKKVSRSRASSTDPEGGDGEGEERERFPSSSAGGSSLAWLDRSRRTHGNEEDEDGTERYFEDEDAEDGEELDDPEEEDELGSGSSNDDDDLGLSSPSKAKHTPSKALIKGKGRARDDDLPGPGGSLPGFITQTAYDLYFQAASRPPKTSNNTFSNLLPTLTLAEYTSLLAQSPVSPLVHHQPPTTQPKHHTELGRLHDSHRAYFSRYLFELEQGFNLLFYGFGSKRVVLNEFAKEACAGVGDVVVLNGFKVGVGLKELLGKIEGLMVAQGGGRGGAEVEEDGAGGVPRAAGGGATALTPLEAQAFRIYNYYRPPSTAQPPDTAHATRPLFIVIHSIDSPHMRLQKVQSILALLASNPRIHLIASVDHVYSPLIWTTRQAYGRGHDALRRTASGRKTAWGVEDGDEMDDEDEDAEGEDDEDAAATPKADAIPSERNFTWLWHDLTTFTHYDVELQGLQRDVTSLVVSGSGKPKYAGLGGASGTTAGGGGGGPAESAGPLTEAGAQYVLTSVTERSRNLFAILARKQLANVEAELDDTAAAAAAAAASGAAANKVLNVPAPQMNRFAVPYDHLFTVAREKFFATSDQGLRGLLGEFRDHGMILTGAAQGGEVVWIPLSKVVLEKLVEDMPEV